MIDVGTTPEPFELLDQDGNSVRSDELRGRPFVLFFYPKASTPGCTTEACAFRDLKGEFDAAGVAVYGISADTVRRQAGFAAKYELNMPLLADPERAVIEAWGVWQEKKNYGKTYMGIVRSTVLVDAEGKVAMVWSPVKVKGHAEAVLATAKQL
jgi:peroxiredoxin Q/BCP